MPAGVDVVILAALKSELDALVQVRASVPVAWALADGVEPIYTAVLDGRAGPIRVAATWTAKTGGIAAATLASRLVETLKPGCLAMCGVCAGHPDGTERGDVVIAERLFQHDEGKVRHDGFQGDLWVDALRDDWLRAAQAMEGPGAGFAPYADPAGDDWKWWFLERLAEGRDPLRAHAFERYFPEAVRPDQLEALRTQRLVTRRGKMYRLLKAGEAALDEHEVLHGAPATTSPFHIHVGPMGSGNSVQADGAIWKRLAQGGARKVLAIEMEAASIGRVAHGYGLPFAVVKGVMDHGDRHKSDRFKGLAARASAEVLCGFLRRMVVPARPHREEPPSDGVPSEPSRSKASGGLSSVFISHNYSQDGSSQAGKLYDRLVSAGLRPFVDDTSNESTPSEPLPHEPRPGEPPPNTPTSDERPPWVFISYSQESESHSRAVLALADQLRSEGIDAWIDQYVESPPEGWPAWMRHQLVNADFVLVICTATYRRRFQGDRAARPHEPGKGVAWEALIASSLLYDERSQNHRFIPVLLPGASYDDIPVDLSSSTSYRLPGAYDDLYRRLLGEGRRAPPIGARRAPMPPRSRASAGAPHEAEWTTTGAPRAPDNQGKAVGRASRALAEFLRDHFDDGELRRLAMFHGGPELDGALPGPGAKKNDVAHELATALRQRSLDDDFFSDLVNKRPKFKDEIAEIQRMFTPRASSASMPPSPPQPSPTTNTTSPPQPQQPQRASSTADKSNEPEDATWSDEDRAVLAPPLATILRDAPRLTAALESRLASVAPDGPPPKKEVDRAVQRILALGRGFKATQELVDACFFAVLPEGAPAALEAPSARRLLETWLPLGYGGHGHIAVLTLRAKATPQPADSSSAMVSVETLKPVLAEVHLASLEKRPARYSTRGLDLNGRRSAVVRPTSSVPARIKSSEVLGSDGVARTIVRTVTRRYGLQQHEDEDLQLDAVLAQLNLQNDLRAPRHYVVFSGKDRREESFEGVVEYVHKAFNESANFRGKGLLLRIVALAQEPQQGDPKRDHHTAEINLALRLEKLLIGPIEEDEDAE